MNFKKSLFLSLLAGLLFFYNNCGKFNGAEQKNASLLNSSNSLANTETPSTEISSPQQQPQPNPQNPIPTPQPTPPLNNGKIWLNEPAGSTQYYDCDFDGSGTGGLCGMVSRTNNTADYANINGVTAMRHFMPAGASRANGQWGLDFSKRREIFVGLVWSTNADFQGICNNVNKMFFIKDPSNSLLAWMGTPGSSAKVFKWYQQERVDNCQTGGFTPNCYNKSGDGTGWFEPNVNLAAASVAPNTGWHKIEIYLKGSTTNSSADGVIRIWIDGILTTNYTNVNHGTDLNDFPGGFRNFEITSTWDGSACLVAPNRDMTKEWDHYYDRIHVSFPNGG